jgi:ATP-dependent DNA ligase
LHLARAFACIEPVFGRIRIANMLVNTFRTLLLAAPRAVLPALFLTTGQLGSSYDPLVLSIGGRIMTDSMVAALGSTPARISSLYKETGDLGDVGAAVAKSKPPSLISERPLAIAELWRKVQQLCGLKGAGSGDRRKAEVQGLLRRCREPDEVRYLIRFLVLNMRIHVNTVTAVLALAQAVAYQEATGERRVEHEEARSATVGKTAAWRGEPGADLTVAGAVGDLSTLGSEIDADGAGPDDGSPNEDEAEDGDESNDEDGSAAKSDPSSSASAAAAAVPQPRSQGTKRSAAAGKAGAAAAAIRGTAADMRAVPEAVQRAMQRAAALARRCLSECPNLDRLVNSLVQGGIPAMVASCRASAGTPIKPMLARITQGIGELGERFAGRAFTCEWKYDGQRAQIHYSAAGFADADAPALECPSRGADGVAHLADAGPHAALSRSPHRSGNRYAATETSATAAWPSPATDRLVRVFSRHLDNTTARWPDCVSAVLAAANAQDNSASCVLAPLSDKSHSSHEREPARTGNRVGGVQPVTSFVIDCELVAVKVAVPVPAAGGEARSTTGPQAAGALLSAASTAASRGLTGAVAEPELAGIISPSLVDSSGIEFDPHEGFSILPFQVLSTRSRPADVASTGPSASASRVAQGPAQLFGPPLAAIGSAVRESEDTRGKSAPSCVGADSATRERADHAAESPVARDDNEPAAPDGVSVCVLAFDLMLLNGEPLLHLPLRQRRELLRAHFRVVPGRFSFAKGIDVDLRAPSCASSTRTAGRGSAAGAFSSVAIEFQEQVWAVAQERVSEELHAAFRGSCEGIMVKLLDNDGSPPQSSLPADAAGRLAMGTAVSVGTKRPRTAAIDAVALGATPQRLPVKKPRANDASNSGADPECAQALAAEGPTGDLAGAGALSSVAASLLTSTSAGAAARVTASRSGGATLVATYQPDVRSNAWLKVKRDYVEGLADTLDVVPIGGWYGNGRKAGWISPVLFGIYNPQTQRYQSLCRCMSGFTDAFYRDMTAFFMRPEVLLTEAEARRMYDTGESPPLWFRPLQVWEIKGADFTLSPVHTAATGLVHPSRGISLRFPRFLRKRLLEDKGPTDATTPAQLAELYRGQSRKLDGAHIADPGGAGRGQASSRGRGRARHLGAGAGAGGGDEDGSAYPFIGELGDDDDVDADG